MKIRDIFEINLEEKIEPVIKVGEIEDAAKLSSEIGSYVVTPVIEKYLDDFIEHYTDTFRKNTTEIGIWISGYFGSGKSHLAKIIGLLCENRSLAGILAAKRFESRIPDSAPRKSSVVGNLKLLDQCNTDVIAFNLNSLSDSRNTPLPKLLLSQYFLHKGFSSNIVFARVVEQELERRKKLDEFRSELSKKTGVPWTEITKAIGRYSKDIMSLASQMMPDRFPSAEAVLNAMTVEEKGEMYNVQKFTDIVLDDMKSKENATKKPCRLMLILDESGQWIEDDAARLAQLQALVEEAAIRGKGKVWVLVTTHEDMGSVYENARALRGDMKKIEGRFRFKFNLTTENIEMVLEDRIFKKKPSGNSAVEEVYNRSAGVVRGLGELANCSQKLPDASLEKFAKFYPFFPYQINLIPDIVKSLRAQGGRGEQLSGSTRTLLAITQDILRAGRVNYLDETVGRMVGFDEVYANLAGEGEVNPDVRRELSKVDEKVQGATPLTKRVAEILYLIHEINFVPRTIDNIARLLVESTQDDLAVLIRNVDEELSKLMKARMVAKIGDQYEFLTGVKRTFEDEVVAQFPINQSECERVLLAEFAEEVCDGFERIPYLGNEFSIKITFDGNTVPKRSGHIELRIFSPLQSMTEVTLNALEEQSLHESETIFLLSAKVPGFTDDLKRFIAMRNVVNRWKGDPQLGDEAHKLALSREANDLEKLKRLIKDSIKKGFKEGHLVFRGSSKTFVVRNGHSIDEAIRQELAGYWPTLYSKFDRVPVRIIKEQNAIQDVLTGSKNLTSDVKELKLFDGTGQLNSHSPLIDEIRVYLATRQAKNERVLGRELLDHFERPSYGWDPNAVRVGIAGLVRVGRCKIVIDKKIYMNPQDSDLQRSLRDSRSFDKVQVVLEETEIDPDTLANARALLIKLTGIKKIDETQVAVSDAMRSFANDAMSKVREIRTWSNAAGFPLPDQFSEIEDALVKILSLTAPHHVVNEIQAQSDTLDRSSRLIGEIHQFKSKYELAFIETAKLEAVLRTLQQVTPLKDDMRQFCEEYAKAYSEKLLHQPGVWKGIQGLKEKARLAYESFIEEWRANRLKQIDDAMSKLVQQIKDNQPLEKEGELLNPIHALKKEINETSEALFLLTSGGRIESSVRISEDKIYSAIEAANQGKGVTTKVRRRKRLSRDEIVPRKTITSQEEWSEFVNGMDQQGRKIIEDGFDIEII